ncbi:MAG: cyclic nucleotide-binding domain-containing protein [Nitrospirae bacterium]|nr:cyclic nucleotide-binding domain-containing protein [Nitrospirota bacterium]
MEDIALLKRIEFFNGLTTLELTQLSRITERTTFKQGQEIVTQGAVCDAVYILKDGSVNVIKDGKLLITLDKGSPIGEISFVDGGPRSASVTAETDSVLIKIPISAFVELMSREKDIACKIYKSIAVTLCQRLRDANDTLLLLSGGEQET